MCVHVQGGPRVLVLEVVLDLNGERLQLWKVHGGRRIGFEAGELLLERGRHRSRFRVCEGRHDRLREVDAVEWLLTAVFRMSWW